jgi:hypothetical protein
MPKSRRLRLVLAAAAFPPLLALVALALGEAYALVSLSRFPRPDAGGWGRGGGGGEPEPPPRLLGDAAAAVVSLHGGFKFHGSLGHFLRRNKLSYARRHGCAYADELPAEPDLAPLRPWQRGGRRARYYAKPRFLLHLMERYPNLQHLLWIDGDAVFTNFSVSVIGRARQFEQLHRAKSAGGPSASSTPTPPPLCLVWAKDGAANAGVMLWRNSPTSRALIRASLATFEDSESFRAFTDQASLAAAIDGNETYQRCQLLLEGGGDSDNAKDPSGDAPTLLQSRVRGPPQWLWRPGHWILHLPNHNYLELLGSLRSVGERMPG